METLFKFVLLFALLITGVVFKTTDLTQTLDANIQASPPSTAIEQDSQNVKNSFIRMVNGESASAI